MPTAGVVRLVSEPFGFDIPLLRNAILQPFEFWLPEGEISLLVQARTTQDGPVLVGRAAASLRAGVAASPQVIRALLAEKRWQRAEERMLPASAISGLTSKSCALRRKRGFDSVRTS